MNLIQLCTQVRGDRWVALVLCSLVLLLPQQGSMGAEGPPLSPRFDPTRFMQSSEVKEGMKGYGLTVFHGIQIEKFEVEILGIETNSFSETNMIIARCTGGPLAKTGVIAGMSGSPIYIENKLIGALAYGWGFALDAICGITPIENMLPVLDLPAVERIPPGDIKQEGMSTSSGTLLPYSPETNSTPDNWSDRLQAFLLKQYEGSLVGWLPDSSDVNHQSHPQLIPGKGWIDWWQKPLMSLRIPSPQGWFPLATPLSFSRMSTEVYNQVASLFPAMGFQPMMGGALTSAITEEIQVVEGAALGVAMVTGDLNMTGIGTVTYVEGKQLLAFGHPMFQDGPTDLPMTTAYIHTILPSSQRSFKMGSMIDVIGALEQDRLPAVEGTIGGKPTLVPFRIHLVNRQSGVDREFHYNLALHRFFTSRFGLICVLDAFDVVERSLRDAASDYTLKVKMTGKPPVILTDQISSPSGTSFEIAMTFSSVMDLLMQNPYERIAIEGIDLEVKSIDRLQRGTIEWIRTDREDVQSGDTLNLHIGVRPYLGELETYQKTIRIPKDFPRGQIQIEVSDAMDYIRGLLRRNPDRFRSRNLGDVLRLLNEVYRNDELFISLTSMNPGASFNGLEMINLPSSVFRIMNDSSERGVGTFMMIQPILEERIQLAAPVVGGHTLIVDVKPRRADRID